MRWPPKAPVVALALVGILATAAFAAFGLTALTRWLLQADELDGRGGSAIRHLLLTPLGRGPLVRLAGGQWATVHFRSQGCFPSIDAGLTFVKDRHGRMSVDVVDGRPQYREAAYRPRRRKQPSSSARDRLRAHRRPLAALAVYVACHAGFSAIAIAGRPRPCSSVNSR